MYNEERYQVKYFLLMLGEPIKKVIIGIKENISFEKLEKELERDVLYFFNKGKTHYPKSTVFINFEVVKKEPAFYRPETTPLEVCH